jgi:hypothetical protein
MRSEAMRRAGILLAATVALLLGASAASAARVVSFSGYDWAVKTSKGKVGPGPNYFSDSTASVWVDAVGKLHLKIRRSGSRYYCAEVIGPAALGYGTYRFDIESDLSALDRNVVLGLFTWSDRPQYAHRELDVEIARWGSATDPTTAQFVVQPYDAAGHLARFTTTSAVRTQQQFTWRAGEVSFTSRRLDTNAIVASYTYRGTDVPKPGDERVRLNLWLFNGAAPTNGQAVEVVVESFAFTP